MKISGKVVAVLVIILALGLLTNQFNEKMKSMNGALSELRQSQENALKELSDSSSLMKNRLDNLTFEVSKVSTPVPGHVHHTVRLFMIRAQAGQLPKKSIVLVGDSITEGLFFDRICGLPVLNAGIGGTGVSAYTDFAGEIARTTQPAVMIIALGVNDAHAKPGAESESVEKWAVLYTKMVQSVKKSGAEPVLMTLLPVEKDRDLGSKYFNAAQIKLMNAKLADIAKNEKCIFVDSFSTLADSEGFSKKGSTVDGVHLTTESYEIWKKVIRKGAAQALEKQGIASKAE